MNLKYLVPTLKSACQSLLIANGLNSVGPRAGLVLGYDPNHDPHLIYVEDAANSKRPTHIASGELLPVDVNGVANSVIPLNLTLDQSVERLTSALLANLASLLINLKSDDGRTIQLTNLLNDYALSGILTGIADQGPVSPVAGGVASDNVAIAGDF